MNTANINYVILEDEIGYDWDDFNVYGAVLYDINNHKIVTSKYGHGTDLKERAESVELEDAVKNNIVTVEKLINVMLGELNLGLSEYNYNAKDALISVALRASLTAPLAIPVNVVRGRKAKGAGFITYAVSEPVRYGLGAYRGEKHYYPVILNTATKTFTKINSFGYCEIDPEFKADFIKNIFENTPKTINEVRRIAHAWAYNMSYSSCDKNNYNALMIDIAKTGFIGIVTDDFVNECAENEQARLDKIEEDKMNEKLPSIIEWVKNNTDKQGDEIRELAIHIYHKYN